MNKSIDSKSNFSKSRNWAVSLWLIGICLANIWLAILYFSAANGENLSILFRMLIGTLSLFKVFAIIKIFQWKKLGFILYVVFTIAIYALNYSNFLFPRHAFQLVVSIFLLALVLQIKNSDKASAWDLLN